jgi:hypothetical protein
MGCQERRADRAARPLRTGIPFGVIVALQRGVVFSNIVIFDPIRTLNLSFFLRKPIFDDWLCLLDTCQVYQYYQSNFNVPYSELRQKPYIEY